MPNARLVNSLCITLLTIGTALPGFASNLPAPKPGWGQWQQNNPTSGGEYVTGFSNGDASASSSWLLYCEGKAREANTETTYWYRLTNLVSLIGVGLVEEGCEIGSEVSSLTLIAIQPDLGNDVCLQVNTDFGNGLIIRESASVNSARIGTIGNGQAVTINPPFTLAQDDITEREWAYIPAPMEGWISVHTRPGDHVNLNLCST